MKNKQLTIRPIDCGCSCFFTESLVHVCSNNAYLSGHSSVNGVEVGEFAEVDAKGSNGLFSGSGTKK